MGSIGLHHFIRQNEGLQKINLEILCLCISLGLFLYIPSTVIVSSHAKTSYATLIDKLKSLDGPVYAPSLGQLQKDFTFYPAAHWAALDDMVRGPGRDVHNNPNICRLLKPALFPNGPAYILMNNPFNECECIEILKKYYLLEKDFGDEFISLRVLPKRWEHGWPRYLYRYEGSGNAHTDLQNTH